MNQSPQTRRSLLIRIRESDDSTSWNSFVEIYAPIIHAYAKRKGMQDADAADVTQQVMRSVFTAISSFDYDRSKGSFRGWLLTITRNHIYKAFQKQSRMPTAAGGTAFQQSLNDNADDASDEETWNRDHEIYLFRWAAEKVKGEFRDTTWQCFWRTAVEHVEPSQVAADLDVTTGAVYIAKSRVLARIREEIQLVENEV